MWRSMWMMPTFPSLHATPGYRGMHSFTLQLENYFVPEANLVGNYDWHCETHRFINHRSRGLTF